MLTSFKADNSQASRRSMDLLCREEYLNLTPSVPTLRHHSAFLNLKVGLS